MRFLITALAVLLLDSLCVAQTMQQQADAAKAAMEQAESAAADSKDDAAEQKEYADWAYELAMDAWSLLLNPDPQIEAQAWDEMDEGDIDYDGAGLSGVTCFGFGESDYDNGDTYQLLADGRYEQALWHLVFNEFAAADEDFEAARDFYELAEQEYDDAEVWFEASYTKFANAEAHYEAAELLFWAAEQGEDP